MKKLTLALFLTVAGGGLSTSNIYPMWGWVRGFVQDVGNIMMGRRIGHGRRALRGVDVHEEPREAAVVRAVATLRAWGAERGDAVIINFADAFAQFNAYMASSACLAEALNRAELIAQARDVLGTPAEGDLDTNIYASFLRNSDVLRVTGVHPQEVFALVWTFVCHYRTTAGAEESGLRDAVVRGFAAAHAPVYDEHDVPRYCYERQLQELFIAALQGRLVGVNIDNVDLALTVEQAISVFMQGKAYATHDDIRRLVRQATADYIRLKQNGSVFTFEDFCAQIRAVIQYSDEDALVQPLLAAWDTELHDLFVVIEASVFAQLDQYAAAASSSDDDEAEGEG